MQREAEMLEWAFWAACVGFALVGFRVKID